MIELPIIELDSIDSTNKYAMQLIDADKAQHGLTIVARSQTAGRGQRGKSWMDKPGASLLMSMIVLPARPIIEQFVFNAVVATSIANILQKLVSASSVRVKWPNDIIVNDKKAGGILIENVLRGSRWGHSVIGLGLNIQQEDFPPDLPYATSLKIAEGKIFQLETVRDLVMESIFTAVNMPIPAESAMQAYNELLYKKAERQLFSDQNGMWEATLRHANPDGTLSVQLEDGKQINYHHGQAMWEW